MCKPASGVTFRDRVLIGVVTNSHRIILEQNGIKDKKTSPDFVKWEYTPPVVNGLPDYNAPFDQWTYHVDQDIVPDWYVEDVDRKRALAMLPRWHDEHIKRCMTDSPHVICGAGNDSTLNAGYDSTLNAGHDSTLNAGDGSTLNAGHDSTLNAGHDSTLKAGDRSTLNAGYDSTLNAGHDSTLNAGHDSTLNAGHDSTLNAGHDSTLKAGDRSTFTAGINSVVVGWWYDGNDNYQVVCRKITEAEADKSYKFEKGEWEEVS